MSRFRSECSNARRRSAPLSPWGADRGILIRTDAELEPLAIAKLMKAIVEREQPGLVITGKQSIDGDNTQTGQMLAALLGWPQGTFAYRIEIGDDVRWT